MPQLVDPFQLAMQNLQSFRSIQQAQSATKRNEAILAKQESEKQQALKAQKDLALFTANPNVRAEDYAKLMAENPSVSEHYKASYDLLDSRQKKATQAQATRLYAYLKAGQTEFALESLEERRLAAENAGLTGEARGAEAMIELVKNEPKAAMAGAGFYLAATMGDQFASVLDKVNASTEAQFRVLTPDEKTGLGLDTKKAFQIGLDGKISTIGGAGVNISIGEKEFGTIPPGFQLIKSGDRVFMEPIPGSPAETAAKALVVKKAQTSTLEDRASNVVIEDIGRLKDKIEKAPWYSPVTGIGGAVLANFPATGRVDAEELKTAIVANVGFDRLQQMREASPTGGALGQVSDRELRTLQAVLGSLSLSQSEGQLIENLDRLNKIYGKILKTAKAYPNAEQFGFGESPITGPAVEGVAPTTPTPPPVPVAPVAPSADLSTMSPEAIAAEIAQLQAGQ